MKKIITVLLLLITFISLTSCRNNYITMGEGVDITLTEELKSHMLNPNNLPSLHFDYNGVRISDYSNNARVIFVQNNQYELSDAFANHLAQFSSNQIVETKSTIREEDKKGANFAGDKLKLDEGTESLEKIIIVTTSDGTRFSYLYRTFVSGGKRYYAYTYVENMSITLEMPLMVVKSEGKNKLVLLPLPYDTKYLVGGANTELESLVEKDTFLNTNDKDTYVFSYPSYLQKQNKDKTFLVNEVKAWYEKHCNGRMENNLFVIEYLGIKFSVDFDQEKVNKDTEVTEPAFKINFIGLA